jgi:hypothetical protein
MGLPAVHLIDLCPNMSRILFYEFGRTFASSLSNGRHGSDQVFSLTGRGFMIKIRIKRRVSCLVDMIL